jgi:chromosome partitioning protein
MLKLTISNQRGGIGKTTTAMTMSRIMAERGLRVLLVDSDPQGSIRLSLDLDVEERGFFHQIICDQMSPESVATPVCPNLDIIFSNKMTQRAEGVLLQAPAREMTYKVLFAPAEPLYDIVIFDMAPSISHIQRCSISYTRNVLIPVGMDDLSVEGARAALGSVEWLNETFDNLNCRVVGFLPTMVNKRFTVTTRVLKGLEQYSQLKHIPILNQIRTDQSVAKCTGQFLQDFDPDSKALEDYKKATDQLLQALEAKHGEQQAEIAAAI